MTLMGKSSQESVRPPIPPPPSPPAKQAPRQRPRKRKGGLAAFETPRKPTRILPTNPTPTELNAFRNAVKSAADSFHRVTAHPRPYLSRPILERVGHFLEWVGRFWNEPAVLE